MQKRVYSFSEICTYIFILFIVTVNFITASKLLYFVLKIPHIKVNSLEKLYLKQKIEPKGSNSCKQVGLSVMIWNIRECLKADVHFKSSATNTILGLFESSLQGELWLKAEHSFKDMLTDLANSSESCSIESSIHSMPLCIQWIAEFSCCISFA